ncbi:Protein of unknown function [Cotesia congregata]|uniref:CCHC-type domain-containing protein n=1 Tax=Cotesia congregata TaxID=51543 RepID=A0A8J2MUB7_COTCN|nr:Protein of unknown function [Cotesia congregata]
MSQVSQHDENTPPVFIVPRTSRSSSNHNSRINLNLSSSTLREHSPARPDQALQRAYEEIRAMLHREQEQRATERQRMQDLEAELLIFRNRQVDAERQQTQAAREAEEMRQAEAERQQTLALEETERLRQAEAEIRHEREQAREFANQELLKQIDELRQQIEQFRAQATHGHRPTNVQPQFQQSTLRPNYVLQEINVRDQVKCWGIFFDGNNDLITFLERIEEMKISYQITKNQLLDCILILLKDNAIFWYRNNRTHWAIWDHFVDRIKRLYLPVDINIRWEEEIKHRTQGPKEKARDYITALQTMMRRYGMMSQYSQSDRLYYNLKPDYQHYIRRSDVFDIQDLIRLTNDYERVLAQEKTYKAPSAPQNTLTPDVVHQPLQKKRATTEHSINTIEETYIPEECCWRCGQRGHFRYECKNVWKKFCTRCGKQNIRTRDCNCPRPEYKKRIGKGVVKPNQSQQQEVIDQLMSKNIISGNDDDHSSKQSDSPIKDTDNIHVYFQGDDDRLYTHVKFNDIQIIALIDTGATRSCINQEAWERIQDSKVDTDSAKNQPGNSSGRHKATNSSRHYVRG